MSDWEQFWTRTRWPYDELNGKTVDFVLTGPEWRVKGKGTFLISQRPNGEQLVQIVVPIVRTPYEGRDQIFTLAPRHAQRIERNSDPVEADFRCVS